MSATADSMRIKMPTMYAILRRLLIGDTDRRSAKFPELVPRYVYAEGNKQLLGLGLRAVTLLGEILDRGIGPGIDERLLAGL